MDDYGFHWTPCRRGGGGGLVVLVVAGAIVAANGQAVDRAATSLMEVVAITVGALLVVGIVAAVVVWRVRRRRARAVRPARPLVLTAVREPVVLEERQAPAAIEAPRTSAGVHVVTSQPARARCAHRERRWS